MARELTDDDIERLVARAQARNGDNTILLAMATDIGEIKADIRAIQGRLVVIEPTLWNLVTKRVEREGARKLVGGVLKLRHAIYAAIVAGAAYIGIQLPKLH